MTRSATGMPARWAALVVLVAAVLAGLGASSASAAPPTAEQVGERVVVLGVPGLSWSDVSETSVPVLWRLAQEGAIGSLTVRTVRSRTCEVDGWLTLSAGRRAADAPGPCLAPEGVADGRVRGWDGYLAAARAASYGARPGTLAERLTAVGACVSADGDAAAVGAADPDGRVASGECAVELRSVAPLPVGAGRPEALRALNGVLADIVSDPASRGTRLVVAGLADGDGPVRPRAVVLVGEGVERGELTSPSTRQPGLVQLQDLTASLLVGAGADDTGLTGRPVTVDPDDRPVAERVEDLVGFEVRSSTLRSVSPQVTGWLATAFALWCAGVALAWWRRPGRRVPTVLAAAGVAVASVPTATFVANLVPWWHAGAPGAAFTGVLAVVVAGMTGAALLAGRRWRHGALAVVAAVSLVVLGGDVLTGSGLQLASVFGQNPTVGGRFYGVGNTSYAVYGVAVLTVVALVAAWRRPGRRWAVALAGLVLLVATVLEGHPSYGADFGGPPGLLLGGLVVLASAAGLRLTVVRVVGAVAAVVVVTGAVAVLDWLRAPAARTHLGEFVQTVVDGGADEVIGRKLAQNLTNLGSPPLVATAVAVALLGVLAWRLGRRPDPVGGRVLRGVAVLALAGFAVNDSGLVIPAYAALVLVPLLVAAGPDPGEADGLDDGSVGG